MEKYSRRLRREMTDAERTVWSKIRGKQLKRYQFYRQKPIGDCIVDFFCPEANLILEIDGGQHYSGTGITEDRRKDDFMRSIGLHVLRFSEREVFENMEGIVERC